MYVRKFTRYTKENNVLYLVVDTLDKDGKNAVVPGMFIQFACAAEYCVYECPDTGDLNDVLSIVDGMLEPLEKVPLDVDMQELSLKWWPVAEEYNMIVVQ